MPSAEENLSKLLSAVIEDNRDEVNKILLLNERLNAEAAKNNPNEGEKSYSYHLLLQAARKENSQIFELLVNNDFLADINVGEIFSLLKNCQELGIKERPKTMLATFYMEQCRAFNDQEGMEFASQFGVAKDVELKSIFYDPCARLEEGYARLSEQLAQPAPRGGGARRSLMRQFNEAAGSSATGAAASEEPEPKRRRVAEGTSDQQTQANALLDIGKSLMESQPAQPVEALKHFMGAVKVYSNCGDAFFLIGQILTNKSFIIPNEVRAEAVELVESLSKDDNNILAKVIFSQINEPSSAPAPTSGQPPQSAAADLGKTH